jgi:hypothetical protein
LPFNIVCQKQGVDYIGKTAKAVASDQNLRIPGTTKSVTYVEEVNCTSSAQSNRSLSGTSMFQSIGAISSGNCSFTLKSNLFNSQPYCLTTYVGPTTAAAATLATVFTSDTTGTLQCRAGAATCATGGNFNISCTGVSP